MVEEFIRLLFSWVKQRNFLFEDREEGVGDWSIFERIFDFEVDGTEEKSIF